MTILDYYIGHAAVRGPVLYHHPSGQTRSASLVYWPRDGGRCRIMFPSGGMLRVPCELVELVFPEAAPS